MRTVCETFDNTFFYEEVLDFFGTHPDAGAGAWLRRQTLDIIRNNIFWVFDRESEILSSLLQNVPTTTPIPTTQRTSRTTTTLNTATGRTLPDLTTRTVPQTTRLPTGIWDNPRLPTHFVPNSYNVNMRTFFSPAEKAFTGFEGIVQIDFNVTTSINEILFHATRDVTILDPIELTGNGLSLLIRDQEHRHVANDYYYIRLQSNIAPGKYMLKMQFQSLFDKFADNTGVFTASYLEDSMTK